MRRADGDGRRAGAAAVPCRRSSCRRGSRPTSEASKAVFAVFEQTSPRRRGASRSTRRSSTCAGWSGSRARRWRSPGGCGATCASRSGCAITVGVARTKFLAKVASGVAKPDGLLRRPARRRAGLPPPAARRAALGRRPGHRAQAARATGSRTVGEVARLAEPALVGDRRARGRAAAARARAQPRPAPRAGRPPAPLDRRRSGRSGRGRRSPRRARRRSSSGSSTGSRRRLRAARRVCRTVVLRLRFDDFSRATRSHTLDEATARTRGDPRDGARAARGGDAGDRAPGAHARRARRSPTSRTTAPCSSRCRSTAAAGRRRSTRTLDDVRDRFGTEAITRAVLLDRDPGMSMPLLPD